MAGKAPSGVGASIRNPLVPMKHSIPSLLAAVAVCGFVVTPARLAAAEAPAPKPVEIKLTEDDFRESKPHRVQTVEVPANGKLVVTLGSNPTTGFSWGKTPEMKGEAILKQTGHRAIGPAKAMPGAGGSEEWTFEATGKGKATLHFSYSRPWAGGEKDVWTLNLTVQVK